MKIAYLLLAHKDPKQIRRLVCSLSESGDFFIHIDKKINIQPFTELLSNIDRVFIIKERYRVYWAGWSMILGYMALMIAAFQSEKHYDRFVLMTGQDYPLMTNREILQEFEKNLKTEYVMAYKISTSTSTDRDKVSSGTLLNLLLFSSPEYL